MDFFAEPKPNGTKTGQDCLKADEIRGFSGGEYNSGSEQVENKMTEEQLDSEVASNAIEHFDSEDQEKQYEINVTEKCKIEDENNGLQLIENEQKEKLETIKNFVKQIDPQEEHAKQYEINVTDDENSGLKLIENEQNEELEMMNDFEPQIYPQEEVSSDGSYASSIETISSGIENDFESHEDSITENEDEVNENMAEDSSSNQSSPGENSDFIKDPSLRKENEGNLDSEGKEQEKINFKNNEVCSFKEEKDVVSSHNSVSLFNSITFPYSNPANCFDIVVPLIGKNVIAIGDEQPFRHRYDLARERNRLKGIEDAPYMPKLSYHEWRKQRDARPQEEKDREVRREKYIAIKTAVYIMQTSITILQEMQNDDPDQGIIERCFIRFLRAPVSALSLLLSSQFVHVMMYIRGSSDFSPRLRYVADQCYMRCHVMFPILDGYNFATVYTSEVIKNIPEQLNGMRDSLLDYDEFEYPGSESDDSAFSDDNENELN